jgi:MFS family permease
MFGTRVFSKFPRFIGEMVNSFRGTYSGVSNLHMILGGMIGPALSGYFFDMRQGSQFLLLMGFVCIFSGLAYALISRSVESRKSFSL